MKKIYVLDEDKNLKEIDAGITEYAELTDAPIITTYQGVSLSKSHISVDDDAILQIEEVEDSAGWTEDEVLLWCNSAPTGKYDILTTAYGTEWLIVDCTKEDSALGKRFRRITADQDFIYDSDAGWVTISDTSARALVFSVTNMDEIPATTVVGNRIALDCYYYSTVGNGTITVTKVDDNGNVTKTIAVQNLSVGKTTTILLSDEISDGTNNFKYIVTNNGTGSLEKQQVANFSISGIELKYTPDFSVYAMKSGDVSFPITFSGTGTKYVAFEVTNGNGEVSTYMPTDRLVNDSSATITLPASLFSHGENTISTYLYMKDASGTEILTRTDTYSYTFPYVVDEDEPIVMTYFDFSTLQEWDTVKIPYRIWAKEAATSIKLSLTYTQTDEATLEVTTKEVVQEYDNSKDAYTNNYLTQTAEHNWQVSNIPHGLLVFRIYLNGEEAARYESAVINVAASDYNFNTITPYIFNFAPVDITDTKSFDTWESNGITMTLFNFNWTTDGIVTDTDKSLNYAPSAYTTVENAPDLFAYADDVSGMSVEFDFMVDENAVDSEPVIKYVDANGDGTHGIFIYPTKAVISYDDTSNVAEQQVVNYQKGERLNLAITIEPKGTETTNRYLKVYLNGIVSKVIQYSPVVEFTKCNYFEFNCSRTEFDLYGFRAYNRALTSGNVLQNYISNFASTDTKISMLTKNNIFYNDRTLMAGSNSLNGEYEVDFDKVKGKIGVLVVLSPSLPESKAYIEKINTIFYEIDEANPQIQWDSKNGVSMATTIWVDADGNKKTRKAPKFGAQGTSSLEYPRKNFKFKFKDKFYIKGHTGGKDKTFTMKADYMDSSGANNITNAQIMENAIIKDDWVNTPVAAGKRLNLDGFPIVMFWATNIDSDGNPYHTDPNTKPIYLGIFNFNYDKKAKALLGWEDEGYDFQGFEFRDNTSDICLEKGISGMVGFKSSNIGFEWRWSPDTDWIDDYHDGNLDNTIDGGYFDEDVNIKTETDWIKGRVDEDVLLVPYFNRYYSGEDQIYIKNSDGSYGPLNYKAFLNDTANDYYKGNLDVFTLEFGVKFKDGKLMYQLPYGVEFNATGEAVKTGSRYANGEGYYKYSRNPEHLCKFEFNTDDEYWQNDENWSTLCELEGNVFARHIEYEEAEDGDYILDNYDGEYRLFENFPQTEMEDGRMGIPCNKKNALSAVEDVTRYNRIVTYVQITDESPLKCEDLMQDIYGHWYYVVDTLAHCDDSNYKALVDSNATYSDELGNNGNGLFIYKALLNYYCASVTTGLCDNFCKNMFVHSYDGGLTWVPAWYDMDTCFGLNNTGAYVFDYDVDFKDSGVFNGSGSVLWDKLYRLCMADIQSEYRTLRQSKISYEQVMDIVYGANIAYKSEAMYNSSAFYRYIIPHLESMSGTQLSAAQGSRLPLLKYWNSNRETFLDSRYGSDDYTSDRITMRMSAPKTFTFNLTPDTNMYLGFAFNQSDASMPNTRSGKVAANTTWSYTYNIPEGQPLQDLNTYIYGASHLVDIGDISYCVPKNINLTTATKLKQIILGTDDEDLLARHEAVSSIQGIKIQLPSTVCKNMKRMDFHNLKYLEFEGADTALILINKVGSVTTNLYPALEYLDTRGSNITSITIGDYTPLVYLGLSDSISNINLSNLLQLTTLELGDYSKVTKVSITNCPKINQLSIISLFQDKQISITADNLQGTYEEAVTMGFMDWLVNRGADLGGTIYVQAIADELLDTYRAAFPNLNVELFKIYPKDVVFGVSGEGN